MLVKKGLKWKITSNHLNYYFHIPQVLFDDSARKDRTILMDRLLHGLSNIRPSNTDYILIKLKNLKVTKRRRWNRGMIAKQTFLIVKLLLQLDTSLISFKCCVGWVKVKY